MEADKPIGAYDFEHPIRPPEVVDDLKRLLGLAAGQRRPGEEFMTTVKKVIVSDEPELGSVSALFDRTVWGHVRWERSVGRPETARMADAFTFEHWYHLTRSVELMFGAITHAAERRRSNRIAEFERRQMADLRRELDQEYEAQGRSRQEPLQEQPVRKHPQQRSDLTAAECEGARRQGFGKENGLLCPQ